MNLHSNSFLKVGTFFFKLKVGEFDNLTYHVSNKVTNNPFVFNPFCITISPTMWIIQKSTESQFLNKMQSAGCRLCRIAREARGESTDGLAVETHGHINSGWDTRSHQHLKRLSCRDRMQESLCCESVWVSDEALLIAYILECKRSTDRDQGFLEVKKQIDCTKASSIRSEQLLQSKNLSRLTL